MEQIIQILCNEFKLNPKHVENVINLIEVKAKSWNPLEDSFEAKNGKSTNKAIRPYLYDVAFQKYVIVQALKEIFPDRSFSVNAFLMLADKSRIATVNSLNQLFEIKSEPNKRSKIIVADNALEGNFEATGACSVTIVCPVKTDAHMWAMDHGVNWQQLN